jgi:rhodanese-related sulfurtransferase
MLSSDNPPAIVDVRTPAEFTGELGHIPGARLVPLNLLGDSLGVLSQYKERDLILVCRTGRRSGIAARELAKVGFARVYNLQGGMVQWNHARGTAG